MMKKYLFLLSLWAFAFTFTSCEGPEGPPGEGLAINVEYYTIKSRDWQQIGSNGEVSFYRYIVDINIGDYIYDKGNVSVFLYLMDGNNEVQAPLPYSIPHIDNGARWTEHYSFDFDSGTISFYVDLLNGQVPPEQEFRVVLTW
jgi:hypothetical protein